MHMPKQQGFSTLHIDKSAQETAHPCNTVSCSSNPMAEWSAPPDNFSPSRSWHSKTCASRRSPRRLECRSERHRSGCTPDALGGREVSHNVWRPRGAEAGLCLLSLQARRTFLELRVVSRIASVMNSGTSSCTYARCWHLCRHSMLHSRQHGSTWHRAHPTQYEYMAAERWPKQVICGNCACFTITCLFFALPLVKNSVNDGAVWSGAHQRCSGLAKRRGGIGRLFRLFLAHCVLSIPHITGVVPL